MKRTIEITEQEIKDLKLIRNYFGEHNKTSLEHLAYNELDKLVKKLQQADVVGRSEQLVCPHCKGLEVYIDEYGGKPCKCTTTFENKNQ